MDFRSLSNPTWLYALDENLPEYVKSASLEFEDTSHLNDIAFADPIKREYPIYSKAAAYLSATHKMSKGEIDDSVFENIAKAACLFNIEKDIDIAAESLFSIVYKEASETPPLASFALDIQGDNKYYPIDTILNLEKSARSFLTDIRDNKLPAEYVKEAAVNILNASKAMHTPVHKFIHTLAEDRLIDIEKAAELLIMDRRKNGISEEDIDAYKELMKEANKNPAIVDEAIELIADADLVYGIKYSATCLPPYNIFHCGNTAEELDKMASECFAINDVLIPISELKKMRKLDVDLNFSIKEAAIIKKATEVNEDQSIYTTETLDMLGPEASKELLRLMLV